MPLLVHILPDPLFNEISSAHTPTHNEVSSAHAHTHISSCHVCRNWLTAPATEQIKVSVALACSWCLSSNCGMCVIMQGPPLRCKWCPGTLLLNATALQNHMESKRHKKKQKLNEDEPNSICLAEDVQGDESVSLFIYSCSIQTLSCGTALPFPLLLWPVVTASVIRWHKSPKN